MPCSSTRELFQPFVIRAFNGDWPADRWRVRSAGGGDYRLRAWKPQESIGNLSEREGFIGIGNAPQVLYFAFSNRTLICRIRRALFTRGVDCEPSSRPSHS